jgi:type I restriction enzyme S subunit
MIPDGWRLVPVGSVCSSLVPGRNKPKIFDGEIPWITTPEIEGRYLPSSRQRNFVSEAEVGACGGRMVPPNSVVITCVGELGITAITTERVVLNQQLHAFVPPSDVDAEYLAYQLSAQASYMASVASTTTIPYMNKGNCESIPILIPPLQEQRGIADILLTWDRTIDVVEALIANAGEQKAALIQSLLPEDDTPPKKCLSGFAGEWRSARLGDVADISKGEQKGRAGLAQVGLIPVINGGTSPSGYTDVPNTPAGTITISEGGNSCGYVDLIDRPFWCGGHCYALRNLKVDRDYLFAVLKHRQSRVMALRVGSGLPNIQKNALAPFVIPVPSMPEQVRIGQIAALADAEIAAHQAQLAALHREKAALMQQLLTGKRRVEPFEEAA